MRGKGGKGLIATTRMACIMHPQSRARVEDSNRRAKTVTFSYAIYFPRDRPREIPGLSSRLANFRETSYDDCGLNFNEISLDNNHDYNRKKKIR